MLLKYFVNDEQTRTPILELNWQTKGVDETHPGTAHVFSNYFKGLSCNNMILNLSVGKNLVKISHIVYCSSQQALSIASKIFFIRNKFKSNDLKHPLHYCFATNNCSGFIYHCIFDCKATLLEKKVVIQLIWNNIGKKREKVS